MNQRGKALFREFAVLLRLLDADPVDAHELSSDGGGSQAEERVEDNLCPCRLDAASGNLDGEGSGMLIVPGLRNLPDIAVVTRLHAGQTEGGLADKVDYLVRRQEVLEIEVEAALTAAR